MKLYKQRFKTAYVVDDPMRAPAFFGRPMRYLALDGMTIFVTYDSPLIAHGTDLVEAQPGDIGVLIMNREIYAIDADGEAVPLGFKLPQRDLPALEQASESPDSGTNDLLPDGWSVLRYYNRADEKMLIGQPEIKFHLYSPSGELRSDPRAAYDKTEDVWFVMPGTMTSHMSVDEAKARAVVMTLAAEEARRRQEASTE